MVLLPQGLHALQQVAKQGGVDLRGADLNLDGGFDVVHNRQGMFNASMVPTITENPRNRQTPKHGRTRFVTAAIHALRLRVERLCAWADKRNRLLLRFARIQPWPEGMKVLADTLSNLRKFCGT